MKKLIAIMLALVLCLGLIACGNTSNSTADTAAPTTGSQKPSPTPEGDATQGTQAETEDSDLATIQENGVLVVGITEYEPMDYKDENGEWTGFDAELARMFAEEELGVECEFFVLADWGKKFVELETKNIDAVWNGMTITEEATSNASVSDPYVINAQVVVMKGKRVGEFTTAESMKKLTFAVENGSAGQSAADDAGFNSIPVSDQATALMEVAAGTSDACIIDITMAKAMTGEGTDYSDLAVGISLNEEQYGVAFRKGSDLTAKFNEFLAAKKADGTLAQLAEKYQLTLAD